MSLFDRLPRRNPKPHPHRAPGRFTRVPLPPGLPGLDTAMYVEMDEPAEPATDMTLVAAPPADPDATMHFPAIEDEEIPAPLPVPHFDVPAGFPPASAWSAGPRS